MNTFKIALKLLLVSSIVTSEAAYAAPEISSVNMYPSSNITFMPNLSSWYQLTNDFKGPGMRLDIDGGTYMVRVKPAGHYSGQYWRFTPTRLAGFYKMTTLYRGQNMCLDLINNPGRADHLRTRLIHCGNYSGQYWRLVPIGNKRYKLTTLWHGKNKCLENGWENLPFMDKCGNYSGQSWIITKW